MLGFDKGYLKIDKNMKFKLEICNGMQIIGMAVFEEQVMYLP